MKPSLLLLPTLLILGLAAPSSSLAQAPAASPPPKPELPSGTLLRPAADFSEWEVSCTYPDDHAKKDKVPGSTPPSVPGANSRPRKVLTTKTGRIIHEQLVDVLNRTTDTWYNGGTQYRRNADAPTWYQSDGLTVGGTAADTSFNPLPANGFRTLDWIKPENYAGIVPFGGDRRCLVFTPGGYQKLDLSNAEGRDKRLAAADMLAYIDSDSRLPVAVRTRGELWSYHFNPPPTQMQTLPPDLAEQIRKGEEARARLAMPAPRPY